MDNKNVIVVGAGASGIFTALAIKKKNPSYRVTIIEKNNKIGKKLAATGNGKCNILNSCVNEYSYNDYSLFNKDEIYDYVSSYINENFGIKLKQIGNLNYPYNESANTLLLLLQGLLKQYEVEVRLEEMVIDYEFADTKYMVLTNKNKYKCDDLVIASGNKSAPKFGSDGNLFTILQKHGYQFSSFLPGLCPIKTCEKTKDVSGQRLKANVSLYVNDQKTYAESGEVLFKDDGLSGIVIMNISSIIARHYNNNDRYFLSLDLFENNNEYDLINTLSEINEKGNKSFNPLLSLFNKPIVDYILKRIKIEDKVYYSEKEISVIAHALKDFRFSFNDFYTFSDSQVTVGGIEITNIKNTFESKIEPHVFILGELLNIDGLCGGYNLMFAIYSALMASDNI
ncbi:MAG: aminoacetone oxidase family FAD-binding enzyme [Bacilli bacterium]|nr:aminoacetone oxidase family FAD-binding enzyme [Bacilli bacterium]